VRTTGEASSGKELPMQAQAVKARLFPDYGGSPLWLPQRRVDWDEIRVSPPLQARLVKWVDDWDHDALGLSEDEFAAEGRDIARLLSEELGWEITYVE
jgi:hypothetical protein